MIRRLWIWLTTVDASDNRNAIKLTVWIAIIFFGILFLSKLFF